MPQEKPTSTTPGPSEETLAFAELVEAQCGVVSRAQAIRHGLTDDTLKAHIAAGRWQRVHHGVYAVHTGPLSPKSAIWAVLLLAGPGSTASHETAAFLLGLIDDPPARHHVTVPVGRRVQAKAVRVHYAHRLAESRHPAKAIPCTRVEDTVLDLIDCAKTTREVADWVTRACQRRLTTPQRLATALARRKKIRWRSEVEALVADVSEGAHSPLELRYLRRVERPHGLPRGARQHRLSGKRATFVDVDYEAYTTRVELDGRVGHVEDGAFRDRSRDNRSAREGITTLRYGHAEVFGEACEVALEVANVLRQRGWTGRPVPCGPDCPLNTR